MVKSFIITGLITASLQSVGFYQESIVGTWQCYHRALEDGTTTSTDAFTGEVYAFSCNGLGFDFNDDFTATEWQNNVSFRYALKDSILTLGNRTYVLESLTDKELVLCDYDPEGLSIRSFRTKYMRVE